jgi:hypothetical protein
MLSVDLSSRPECAELARWQPAPLQHPRSPAVQTGSVPRLLLSGPTIPAFPPQHLSAGAGPGLPPLPLLPSQMPPWPQQPQQVPGNVSYCLSRLHGGRGALFHCICCSIYRGMGCMPASGRLAGALSQHWIRSSQPSCQPLAKLCTCTGCRCSSPRPSRCCKRWPCTTTTTCQRRCRPHRHHTASDPPLAPRHAHHW